MPRALRAEATVRKSRDPGPTEPRGRLGAAQQGMQAGQQLPRTEGLGQIVVGADLQAHHPVDLLAPGGQHEDGHLGLAAQFPRQAQAILPGEHQIEHDGVRHPAPQGRAHPLPVRHRFHRQAIDAQVFGQQLPEAGIIVDDQDATGGGGTHGRSVPRPPGPSQ